MIFAATVVKIQGFRVFLKGFKKEAQKVPKGDLQEAKMLPRSAPGAPGAAQEAPRPPQEPPRAPQERPKSRPRGEKKEQKR